MPLWAKPISLQQTHFLFTGLTAVAQKDPACFGINATCWYLWQPAHRGLTLTMQFITRTHSDIQFIWEKEKQRGFKSTFILSSVLFICMGLECTSVCVRVCMFPGSREAKQRLTSSRRPWVCMCLPLCKVSSGDESHEAGGRRGSCARPRDASAGKATQGWRPCRALRHPTRRQE